MKLGKVEMPKVTDAAPGPVNWKELGFKRFRTHAHNVTTVAEVVEGYVGHVDREQLTTLLESKQFSDLPPPFGMKVAVALTSMQLAVIEERGASSQLQPVAYL
jgi:hypothetical protein